MPDLVKIFLKYNKRFTLPKCVNKKCSCFVKTEKTVICRPGEPLSYVIQVQSVLKRYKKKYDKHYSLACLRLCDTSKIEGRILVEIMRDHFATLSIFQDYLAHQHEKYSNLAGAPYLHFLRNVIKRSSFVKNQMNSLISLFKEIDMNTMYPKMRFDLLIYFHLHTTVIFKKVIMQLECM